MSDVLLQYIFTRNISKLNNDNMKKNIKLGKNANIIVKTKADNNPLFVFI